jgi:amidase
MRMLGIAMTRGGPARDGKVATLSHWFDLLDSQARLQRAWGALFEQFDAVIAPASGVNAFPHIAERNVARRTLSIDGEDTPSGVQFAWAGLATFPNLPATSVPVGIDPRGLPIGVQVITNRYRDHDAIAVAALCNRLSRS